MSYTIAACPEAFRDALGLARAPYQESLIMGREAWSGATLRGKAARYGDKYKTSRDNLLARLRAAGILITMVKQAHGKLVLVIGGPSPLIELPPVD